MLCPHALLIWLDSIRRTPFKLVTKFFCAHVGVADRVAGTDTFERVFAELKAGGTRVLPILYNDESGQKTLLTKLRRLFASPPAQQQLITQMIQLAVDHDLDGWNLDFGSKLPPRLQPFSSVTTASPLLTRVLGFRNR